MNYTTPPATTQARPRFLLELEALPGLEGEPDAIIRLRALLKAAGRRWRFRCLSVCEVSATTPHEDPAP